jgi:hypothetical protein
MPMILALLAAAGGGYYYMVTTGEHKEVKAKAKEVGHAAEGKAKELEKEGRAKVADAQVSCVR